MKFPFSWLKNYIDIELPPQQVAKILTMAGIEVDSLERASLSFEGVVIGQVMKTERHPNADKLTVAEVTNGSETFQVVCAAPNCRPGMKTALAEIGATIRLSSGEEIKIKKSKIRGIESFGMLCAGAELGISNDDEGIIEFADHLKLGADLAEMYSDTIFEVSLTPNLNHAASVFGIARELSALTAFPLKPPLVYVKEGEGSAKEKMTVEIEAKKDCSHYSLRIIEGVRGVLSPDWLKKRLADAGIRPCFLAVDVTNFVLLEMGQPLHAFDLDEIEGKKVIVRGAKPKEKIETLDGKVRELEEGMLLIADEKKPLAVAGVMGGALSEVKASTDRILLESAHFRPGSIRRTSKRLGLSSDSSRRFERGADPLGVTRALDRAAMLIEEISKANVLKGIVEAKEEVFSPLVIPCRVSKVNALLGTRLGVSEVEDFLQRLQFITSWDGEDTLSVTCPSYRTDVKEECDLIEEVARMIGYDNIPRHDARHTASSLPNHPMFLFEQKVRFRMIEEGLQEFLTCDLIGPSILEIARDPRMPETALVKVKNPTSIEQSVLRTSLLQGLLESVKFNVDRENKSIAAFEVGRVHMRLQEAYHEPTVLGIVLTGKSRPHHIDPKPHDFDFYDLKGIVENLFESLNIKRYSFRFSELETFHSGRQALIQVDGIDVGSLGEIHPNIQAKLDVPGRIYFAEISLTDLLHAKRGDLKMRPVPLYPSSERDWTVTVKEGTPVYQLISSIQRIPSKLLEEVSLVDIFRGDKVGEELKNVTLHFVYRDREKTVSQEEVDAEHERIIAAAKSMHT